MNVGRTIDWENSYSRVFGNFTGVGSKGGNQLSQSRFRKIDVQKLLAGFTCSGAVEGVGQKSARQRSPVR